MSEAKKWTKDSIKELLDRNEQAVLRGIVAIYRLQTTDEQINHQTSVSNGVGFSGVDADFMSSLAEGIIQYGRLTPKQFAIGKNKIRKYAQQLANIANSKEVLS